MEHMSADITKLAQALSLAQSSIKGAREDSANPFFKSKYADLTSVWEACRDSLITNGFAVTQLVDGEKDNMNLITILLHSSGQWLKSSMPITPKNVNAQEVGSAMTYARRYALAAIVGVCPADDDGEKAMARNEITKKTTEPEKPKDLISEDNLNTILELLEGQEELRGNILKAFNVTSIADLPGSKASSIITRIKEKIGKKDEVFS